MQSAGWYKNCRGNKMTKLKPIYPGNQPPNNDNVVTIVAKTMSGRVFLAQDRRLGRRSWMYWKCVVAWQELPEATP